MLGLKYCISKVVVGGMPSVAETVQMDIVQCALLYDLVNN